MNFPIEYPLFRFLYWFINTPGIGGVFILLLAGSLITVFLLSLRWVVLGAYVDETDQYAYPTSTLIEHQDDTHGESSSKHN